MAGAVLYLASPAGAWVTGAEQPPAPRSVPTCALLPCLHHRCVFHPPDSCAAHPVTLGLYVGVVLPVDGGYLAKL